MFNSKWGGRLIKAGLVLAGIFIAGIAAQKFYFEPRYGGITGYLVEGFAVGSTMEQAEGDLARIQSYLSIYYSDTGGKYPPSLDVLWQEKRYLEGPPPHADIFIETRNGKFKRAHWHRDTAKVKVFHSRAEADDSGGWGYVADPASPEWGTVFINCTHQHWKKRIPWNLSAPPAPQLPPRQEAEGAVQ